MPKKLPSIFKKLPSIFRSRRAEARSNGWETVFVGNRKGSRNITPKTALSISAYFAAINTIACDTSCLPLHVFERLANGDKQRVEHSASSLLMVSPDGESPAIRVRAALMGHVLGWGNGYMEIVRNGAGDPTSLHLLDPAITYAERVGDRLLYNLGDGRKLDQDSVIHVAGLGFDGLTGYTPCSLLRTTLSIARSADEFSNSYFENASTPNGYLRFKQNAPFKDEAEANRFRETWDKYHKGTNNAGRTAILTGDTEFIPLSVKPEDAQLLSTRLFSVQEIARIFRLPPSKLGDYSQAHYNNIEAANLDYLQTCLLFWLESIEAEFNRKLFRISERGKYFVEHNTSAYMRGSIEQRTKHYLDMFSIGVYSQNEIRSLENLPNLGPMGDVRYISKQIQDPNEIKDNASN